MQNVWCFCQGVFKLVFCRCGLRFSLVTNETVRFKNTVGFLSQNITPLPWCCCTWHFSSITRKSQTDRKIGQEHCVCSELPASLSVFAGRRHLCFFPYPDFIAILDVVPGIVTSFKLAYCEGSSAAFHDMNGLSTEMVSIQQWGNQLAASFNN